VFVTLTAPSFGPVHRGPGKPGQDPPRCRPRPDKPLCPHGQPETCGRRHEDGDPAIGQPLCPDCFSYPCAVLFNASVPPCGTRPRRGCAILARQPGISRRQLRDSLRLSFGKVIEYQHRALIHIHAVIRADGPEGPDDDPPPWADTSLLRTAVIAAAPIPAVTLPHPARDGSTLTLAWGRQLDVRIVRHDIAGELSDHKVAAYIGKFASKGTDDIGGIPPDQGSSRSGRLARHTARTTHDHHMLAARPEREICHPAAREMGAPAPIPRPLLHPLPPLLRHPPIPALGTPRHPHRLDPPASRTPRPARHHHQRMALRRHRLAPPKING
jgi:hypothetical protein